MNSIAMIQTDNQTTIVLPNGNSYTVSREDPIHNKVIEAIDRKDYEFAERLLNPAKTLQHEIAKENGAEEVTISNGVVMYNNTPIRNSLTKRLISMIDAGMKAAPMIEFFKNLMQNPSKRAVDELYDFMEATNLPITDDGHFYAYKKITHDWLDVYSRTLDNSIGSVVKVRRNMVDEDKNNTCSEGLHFCGRSYLPHYPGDRVVMVKINPKDVVSIPADYNNAKGRCCKYVVVAELTNDNEYVPSEDLAFATQPTVDEVTDIDDRLVINIDEDKTLNGNKRKVEQYTISGRLINTFDSASDAERVTLIDSSNILKVCRNERKTAGGFVWKFKG